MCFSCWNTGGETSNPCHKGLRVSKVFPFFTAVELNSDARHGFLDSLQVIFHGSLAIRALVLFIKNVHGMV